MLIGVVAFGRRCKYCFWELFVSLGCNLNNWRSTCNILENMLNMCARRLKVEPPLHTLTVHMFRTSAKHKPKFKVKAAEGRHMLPIVEEMLRTCFPLVSPHEQTRYQCLAALHRCYMELGTWTPKSSPERLCRNARQHLLLYCQLRAEATNDLLWCLFPKHHLFIHLAEAAVTNPRPEWNYADESEIGEAAKQAAKTNVAHLSVQLLQRYRATFEV